MENIFIFPFIFHQYFQNYFGRSLQNEDFIFPRKSDTATTPSLQADQPDLSVGLCWAMFEFLAGNWDSSRKVVEILLEIFQELDRHREEVWEFFFKLIQWNEKKNPQHILTPSKLKFFFFPSLLSGMRREIFSRALNDFPFHPSILSHFFGGGDRGQVASWTRRFLDDLCKKYFFYFFLKMNFFFLSTRNSSPLLWIFSIYLETNRGGSEHRIKTLFDRATQDPK